jgi:FlaA1/EpsC-like NDP-sugar epimerase
LRSLGGEVLIIADKELTKEDLLTVADDCLKYNFKMYSVPSIIGCVNRNEICESKEFSDYGFIRGNSIVIDKKSISSQLKGKTVLITGAAGDIGCEIVWQVLAFAPEKLLWSIRQKHHYII